MRSPTHDETLQGSRRSRTLACLAALALVLGFARAARADDPTEVVEGIATVESAVSTGRPPGLFGTPNVPPLHLELSTEHTFHTPLNSFPGSFTLTRERVTLGTWLPLPGPFYFGLDFDVEASDYDGSWELYNGNHHNNQMLWQLSVGPKVVCRLNDEKVSLYVGTVFFLSGALDAEVQDSLRYEIDLAVQVKVTPAITLTLGVGIRTGIESTPSFYPIASFEYGRLKLFLEGGTLKTTFPLIEKASGVHALDLLLSFGVDLRQYRLAEYAERNLTSNPGGVLRDTRFPLSIGARYIPVVGMGIVVDGGANFWQKLEVDDHLGRPLGRSHGQTAPFVGARLEIDI